jgi:hypothetical protein
VDDLEAQRERAAQNQSLFREINERIDELEERWHTDSGAQYLCECLDTSCMNRIPGLSRHEYQQIRSDPAEFVILPGHEKPDVEEIVERTPHWLIVRKIGTAGEVAEQLAAQSATTPPSKQDHVG